jgi:hypothetical protein
MNINFNLIPNVTVSVFKEHIVSSLTAQQKSVLAIALTALGCLAVGCATIRICYFKATSLSDQNSQDLLDDPMPNGTQMAQQQFYLKTKQELYLKSIALNPNNSRAYINLGATLPLNGHIQLLDGTQMTKQQLYLKSIQLDPSLAPTFSNLGDVVV